MRGHTTDGRLYIFFPSKEDCWKIHRFRHFHTEGEGKRLPRHSNVIRRSFFLTSSTFLFLAARQFQHIKTFKKIKDGDVLFIPFSFNLPNYFLFSFSRVIHDTLGIKTPVGKKRKKPFPVFFFPSCRLLCLLCIAVLPQSEKIRLYRSVRLSGHFERFLFFFLIVWCKPREDRGCPKKSRR